MHGGTALVPVTETHTFQPFVSDLQVPLNASLGPKTACPLVPVRLHRNTWVTHQAPPGQGDHWHFSQAIHLALCTLHQCNIFYFRSIWAECQLQLGTVLETHPHPACRTGQTLLSSPSFYRTGVAATTVVSILPACLQPPSQLPMPFGSEAGPLGPASSAEGLVCFCCSERKLFCISQALDNRTLKQQELGFTEDESTAT